MTRTLRSALFACIVFFLLFRASRSFLEKAETVCHSSDDCGHAHLSCSGAQKRLALLRVQHGHHQNLSFFDQCPSRVQNCSTVHDYCCKSGNASGDCLEDYSSDVFLETHRKCSAAVLNDGRTCDLKLPPLPQPATGLCSSDHSDSSTNGQYEYQSLSSYVRVDYACVNESDVAEMCTSSQRKGSLLYTLWTLSQAGAIAGDVNFTSCRCVIDSATSSAVDVFIRALDVRIPRNDLSKNCSSIRVADKTRTRFNTSCSIDTTIFFDSRLQPISLQRVTTPIDIVLSLNVKHAPEIVWFGFNVLGQPQSQSGEITLTCFKAGENLTADLPQPPAGRSQNGGSSPSRIAAAVAGGVSAVVVLVGIGFLCFYCANKRKKQASGSFNDSKRQKAAKTWWEKTREEDRMASMSHFGPASRVIVDSGRYMRYGKDPTTQRTYRTTEDNPPILIVPGSTFYQVTPESDTDGNCEVPNGRERFRFFPGGAAIPRGRRLDPRVMYNVNADLNPVTFVIDVSPTFRRPDIPPLTITELPD